MYIAIHIALIITILVGEKPNTNTHQQNKATDPNAYTKLRTNW